MKTQTQTHRRHAAGFTLVELAVVVAIMVVLAALTLALLPSLHANQNIKKTKVQIAMLEAGLESYRFDNGSYPVSTDAEGRKGEEVLYKHLYYDGYEAKQAGASSPRIYLASLDPENSTKSDQAWIEGRGAQARIVDPWSEPYRYRSGDSPNAENPDFDLWSCGPDKKTSADPKDSSRMNDIKRGDN